MQSVSSRIWTRVAVSISYKDNHYTTGTSKIFICIINKIVCLEIIFINKMLITIIKKCNNNIQLKKKEKNIQAK